jgi:hypothetical protein
MSSSAIRPLSGRRLGDRKRTGTIPTSLTRGTDVTRQTPGNLRYRQEIRAFFADIGEKGLASMRAMPTSHICWIVALLCLCCSAVEAGERRTYDLRYRPAVGQRWAFQQSTDSTLNIESGVTQTNVIRSTREAHHSQVIVTCEEVLDVTDGKCTAKRVTFGKGCFSFEQVDDQPRRDQRMVYSDKTVNFRMLPDGTLDQDFGVKTNGRHMRLIRDAIVGRTTFFPKPARRHRRPLARRRRDARAHAAPGKRRPFHDSHAQGRPRAGRSAGRRRERDGRRAHD